jgi:type I restriction enzyme S subunit
MPANTVLLTKRAPVGAVAVAAVPMATNQGFLNFTCGPRLRPLYLAYWLRANREYLEKVANGSTYPELYQSDLFEFELAVPSLDLQDRVISVVNALQYSILLGSALEQSSRAIDVLINVQQHDVALRELRDHALPMLLSGDIDVSRVISAF